MAAFEKAGFRVVREGKHVVMSDGMRYLTIPRASPLNPHTPKHLIAVAGLTDEDFRKLL